MKVNFTTLFLLSFLIFFQKNSFGSFSNTQDSLEAILTMDTNVEEKINARNELAELFFKYNVNKSIAYLNENISTSEISNFPKSQAKTNYLLGRAQLLISDFEKGYIYLNKAKDYFKENQHYKELGDCFKDLGTIQLHQNFYQEAENYYVKGLEAYTQGGYEAGLAHCNLNLGNVYIEQYLYTKGIQYYYNALEKYERLEMHRYIGMCNNNVGNIYKEIQNFPKAHEHYQRANQSYLIDQDSLQIINVQLNIGATFLDEEKYDESIQIMYKVLADARSTGFAHPIPMIYNNLTASHINLGNLDLAQKNNALALQKAKLNNNQVEIMNAKLLNAEIHLRKKKYSKALGIAKQIYKEAKGQNQLEIMADASRILYSGYKGKDQFQQSLAYFEIFKNHRDSLFNESKLKVPLSKDFEYQLEKQKREQTLQQEKDRLVYQAELDFQRLIMIVFAIGFLILGLAAFLIYRNFQAKRVAEKELEKKNTILEKYIESNIQLEQFAHIASHDLKSPLRTVGSFSSLLKRRAGSKLNENEMEYLDMISNAAKLMWNLVDDLMTYSQVNSLQMNLQAKDVNKLLQEVITNLDFSIKEKNAVIDISNLPKKVMVDETKIRQVFQNLIANGLKFMPEKSTPLIKIDCIVEGGFWKFSIQDNGIGIAEEYREKIFKPYKQLHTKDKFEGTGMGLAICKKIVEKHGGEISFESELGKGTTFYFTIPMALEGVETRALEYIS